MAHIYTRLSFHILQDVFLFFNSSDECLHVLDTSQTVITFTYFSVPLSVPPLPLFRQINSSLPLFLGALSF